VTVSTISIELSTKGKTDIVDITSRVNDSLKKVNISCGIVTVFAIGSTGAVTTIEYEPALEKDLKRFLETIIPTSAHYDHDETWGDANGHSHIRASLLGPSLTVPFNDNTLCLGTWQQIIFIDFDNRPRKRKVILQFVGQ